MSFEIVSDDEVLGQWAGCISDEEAYESRLSATKIGRKFGAPGGIRAKVAARRQARELQGKDAVRQTKPRDRARVTRKLQTRQEEMAAQLDARKLNPVRRRGPGGKAKQAEGGRRQRRRPDQGRDDSSDSSTIDIHNYILPANELGMEEDGSMFGRLIEILEGDDITPEDFDLLLQLDARNEKLTLEESQISELELLVVGAKGNGVELDRDGRTPVSLDELGAGYCLICLEPFSVDAELRRLPCNHVYCRGCIDRWLAENSIRCPDLSCYWASSSSGDGGDNRGGATNTTVRDS